MTSVYSRSHARAGVLPGTAPVRHPTPEPASERFFGRREHTDARTTSAPNQHPDGHNSFEVVGSVLDCIHNARNPRAPQTTFGYIVEALRQRREADVVPYELMKLRLLNAPIR